MHLDAQVIDMWMVLRQTPDHFADPEANLEAARRTAAENRIQVQWAGTKVHAVGRPQLRERALLCGRHAAGAQDETANGAPCLHGRKVCLISCRHA